ncbi:MAG: hypothetical protein K5858_08345 [Lachnospiraceae bacterium]|nr:hypothetical protein [Lachnospiraceae bacterium]
MKKIHEAIRKAQVNIAVRRTLKCMCTALTAGGCFALFLALVSLFIPIPFRHFLLGIIIAGSLILGLAVGIIKAPGKREAALILDGNGLKERLVTALENEGKSDVFSKLQREDTINALSGFDVKKVLKEPVNLIKPVIFVMLFILAEVVFSVPTFSHEKAARIEALLFEKAELNTQKEKDKILAAAIDRAIAEILKADSNKELADIAKRLNKKKAESTKNEMSLAGEKEKAGVGNINEGAGKEKGENTSDTGEEGENIGQNGENGDANTEKTGSGSEGGKSTSAGNVTGKKTGDHSENGTGKESAQGEGTKSKGTGTASETAKGEGKDGEDSGSEGKGGNEGGNGDGNGNGGEGTGNGNGNGGSGSGKGGGYNKGSEKGVERADIDMESESILIPGETVESEDLTGTMGDGDTFESGNKKSGQGEKGTAVAYDSVINEYKDRAVSYIDNGKVDLKYKDLIKNYFEGLSK